MILFRGACYAPLVSEMLVKYHFFGRDDSKRKFRGSSACIDASTRHDNAPG